MSHVSFDRHGHLEISPQDFLALAEESQDRLVDDVLCHGTPAAFGTYADYRAFIQYAASALGVSPFSIWVRGSAQLGFSISPRASKVWVALGDESDIDLAIVDPDHYHLFDVQIRMWERRTINEPRRLQKLRDSRRFYCYRHYDLPQVPICDVYKNAIAAVGRTIGRDVSAFFFRDTWALHDRYVKDVRDLLSQNMLGLPAPKHSPRARVWFEDKHLLSPFFSTNDPELNLACTEEGAITDAGIKGLHGVGRTEKLWLDGSAVTDAGITALGPSRDLRFLSLANTRVTNGCLAQMAEQFPLLECLIIDNTAVTDAAAVDYCRKANLATLSACDRQTRRRIGPVRNRSGRPVRLRT